MNESEREVRILKTKDGEVRYTILDSIGSEEEQKENFYKFLADFIIRNAKKNL